MYLVTRQYLRDMETPSALFLNLNDARMFIDTKLSSDKIINVKVIYRIFDGETLIQEFNMGDKFVPRSFGINGEKLFLDFDARSHKVYQVKQMVESLCAKFDDLSDAQRFIKSKLSVNSEKKETYRIYSAGTLIAEMDSETFHTEKLQEQESQGKKSSIAFRPTPFATSPRPKGAPPKWLIDEEDDDKDKK